MTTIDIHQNRNEVIQQLKNLPTDAKPVFGKMTPQHMVEHLAFSIRISSGKGPQKLYTPQDVADSIKEKIIYSETQLQPGIKNPILGDELAPLRNADLLTAIEELQQALADFDKFYAENPTEKMIQPRMGPLNYTEWSILHNKHITHHFKQFELI
jgi:hypothetical protein